MAALARLLLRRCLSPTIVLRKSIIGGHGRFPMATVAREAVEPGFAAPDLARNEGGGKDENDGGKDRVKDEDEKIYLKRPGGNSSSGTRDATSVTMPMSFMTGSIVGKRFYKEVTTRMADDGNGWTVMLDYRTLKSPSKRPLKIPSLALAKAIAAEWEYQVCLSRLHSLYLFSHCDLPLPSSLLRNFSGHGIELVEILERGSPIVLKIDSNEARFFSG